MTNHTYRHAPQSPVPHTLSPSVQTNVVRPRASASPRSRLTPRAVVTGKDEEEKGEKKDKKSSSPSKHTDTNPFDPTTPSAQRSTRFRPKNTERGRGRRSPAVPQKPEPVDAQARSSSSNSIIQASRVTNTQEPRKKQKTLRSRRGALQRVNSRWRSVAVSHSPQVTVTVIARLRVIMFHELVTD
ncbi:hypothetical protein LZ32DRAFT_68331 [Colletotrichum eremochloae]|nr:hypothetical protein LZ32DRAFT_68331 [Colletotrichum eremochloae]